MITDPLGRSFKKLRVSLTHDCNYACLYCSDRKLGSTENIAARKLPGTPVKKVLVMPELLQIIQNLHNELNLNMVRLTGGEPMLHPRIETIVAEVKKMGIPNIGITTNGHVFYNKAEQLRNAGLNSVNISIDALNDATFKEISQYNGLSNVLKSIDAAIGCGLEVKLNTVVLNGKNSDQILPLLAFAINKGITIRFLELMAMGPLHRNYNSFFFSEHNILSTISAVYNMQQLPKEKNATAHYWSIDNRKAFGVIANDSSPFCTDCNRLRLDSYGNIYGCLSSLKAIAINTNTRSLLLKEALQEALFDKQQAHFIGNARTMQSIGG